MRCEWLRRWWWRWLWWMIMMMIIIIPMMMSRVYVVVVAAGCIGRIYTKRKSEVNTLSQSKEAKVLCFMSVLWFTKPCLCNIQVCVRVCCLHWNCANLIQMVFACCVSMFLLLPLLLLLCGCCVLLIRPKITTQTWKTQQFYVI